MKTYWLCDGNGDDDDDDANDEIEDEDVNDGGSKENNVVAENIEEEGDKATRSCQHWKQIVWC